MSGADMFRDPRGQFMHLFFSENPLGYGGVGAKIKKNCTNGGIIYFLCHHKDDNLDVCSNFKYADIKNMA